MGLPGKTFSQTGNPEMLKPRDMGLEKSSRFEIKEAHVKTLAICQLSERCDYLNTLPCKLKTAQNLMR